MQILHQYEPLSDEMITDSDGIQELIITPNTMWVPCCEFEGNDSITNSEYNSIVVTQDTVHCYACSEVLKEQSKEYAWGIEFSRPIRAKIGKLLMLLGARLTYGPYWDSMINYTDDYDE